MRRALWIVALTLSAGIARADVAPPLPDTVDGTWYGAMRQVDVKGETTYPMTVVLNGDHGSTDYPKLNCGGELERLTSAAGGYVIYKETITRGAFEAGKPEGCIDGIVTLHADRDEILLGWFAAFDGEPMLASGRLSRGQFRSH